MLAFCSTKLAGTVALASRTSSRSAGGRKIVSQSERVSSATSSPMTLARHYAGKPTGKKFPAFKKHGKSWTEPTFHVSKAYRPSATAPHSLADDQAAALAYTEAMEAPAEGILSIEEMRRKVNAKKNVEKVIQQLTSENEDPLIRQAYEELEDEDRIRRGLAPLRRAPPGKLKVKWDSV